MSLFGHERHTFSRTPTETKDRITTNAPPYNHSNSRECKIHKPIAILDRATHLFSYIVQHLHYRHFGNRNTITKFQRADVLYPPEKFRRPSESTVPSDSSWILGQSSIAANRQPVLHHDFSSNEAPSCSHESLSVIYCALHP